MLVVVIALMLCPVRVYGETEFWFASLKVFMILGLLVLSVVLFLGGGPTHKRLGFHYWKYPGPAKEYLVPGAAGRLCGVVYVACFSVFSFNFAPELLVITAGEMHNPRQNPPKTTKHYFTGCLSFMFLACLPLVSFATATPQVFSVERLEQAHRPGPSPLKKPVLKDSTV